MELAGIEASKAVAEYKNRRFVATLRVISNKDLDVLCLHCQRWKIQAMLALIKVVEEGLSDKDKCEDGASGSGGMFSASAAPTKHLHHCICPLKYKCLS